MMLSFIKSQVKRAFQPSVSLACDNYALGLLRSFDFDYIPWTAAAMRPSAICALLNEILINRRKTVVEFGAGISTLYIAKMMQDIEGQLISFEHDRAWLGVVEEMLAKHKVADSVKVVHAPLGSCSCALDGREWYDDGVVKAALAGKVLDGIIVDGPPASDPALQLARYPAVPVVREFLGDSFFVFLHDIDRPGETCVFKKWENILEIKGDKQLIAGQYGVLRKGGGFATVLCQLD